MLPELAGDLRRPALRLAAAPRIRVGERPALFAASLALYLGLAVRLVLASGVIVPDAWSRVGNAAYVVASRDPHLAAIGFVWNPLPSLAMLPLVALGGLWPPLVTQGFAANIVSALFMAGAVVVVSDIGRDLRLARPLRLAFVALFALHPMIALYGANGMSEAPFLLFLLLATRHAIRWFEAQATSDLALLGLALGGAYLARYEAIAAAVCVIPIVVLRRVLLDAASRRERLVATAADLSIALGPFVAAFVGWALASWVITGSGFETFTSVYGNASQVAMAGGTIAAVTGKGLDAIRYFGVQLLVLSPGLPLLVVGALALAAVRRPASVGRPTAVLTSLAPTLVLVGVLAFGAFAMMTGSSFGWLRFGISAIPLATVAGMLLLGHAGIEQPRAPSEPSRAPARRVPSESIRALARRAILPALVLASLAIALPVAVGGMSEPGLGREEWTQLAAIEGGDVSTQDGVRATAVASQAAAYLDGLRLPDGSVVVDVAIGFPIVLQSRDMRQFVITPDRDFQRVVADPVTFHARYLLVPNGQGYSALDAVGRAYPGLYDDGAGIATLVRQFGDGAFAWRLYAVKG